MHRSTKSLDKESRLNKYKEIKHDESFQAHLSSFKPIYTIA
jgi:hypothetical protein